mmetsp:Transcript_58222/g.136433  ORF Transcript_58222/g.136433 Transcript_58222/m.136433 type:complete len:103 (+) Transcript_58222:63-371(+)
MGGSGSCMDREADEYDANIARPSPFQGRLGRWIGGMGRTCGCWDDVLDNQEPVLGKPEVWRPATSHQEQSQRSTGWPSSWQPVAASTAYMEQRSSRLQFGQR